MTIGNTTDSTQKASVPRADQLAALPEDSGQARDAWLVNPARLRQGPVAGCLAG